MIVYPWHSGRVYEVHLGSFVHCVTSQDHTDSKGTDAAVQRVCMDIPRHSVCQMLNQKFIMQLQITIKYDYPICSEFDYNFRFQKSFIMIYNNNIYSVYPSISIIIITFQIQNQCDSKPFVHAYVQVPWTEFTT